MNIRRRHSHVPSGKGKKMIKTNGLTVGSITATDTAINIQAVPAVINGWSLKNEERSDKIGERRMRTIATDFTTREDGGAPAIEGYFAVFNSTYELGEGMTESIAPGAFTSSLGNDVRALTNHDTTLVLGRTKNGTLEIRQDDRGLWGRVQINPNDADAMNLYERVKRGDVDQCSFGFDIRSEETEFRDDGSVHWTITDVELYEVSCCTFPAYTETSVSVARANEKAEIQKRRNAAWKAQMKERLKNGTKTVDASQED